MLVNYQWNFCFVTFLYIAFKKIYILCRFSFFIKKKHFDNKDIIKKYVNKQMYYLLTRNSDTLFAREYFKFQLKGKLLQRIDILTKIQSFCY